MGIVDLLANDNYIIVNKTIAKTLGLEEAILLGELASEYRYWKRRDELKDGFFYSTVENVKENTTLSDKRQRAALETLKDAGLIEVKLMGLPAKRYVKLNAEQLLPLLTDNDCCEGRTSFAETAELEEPKRQTNNNNLKNNKNSNNQKKYRKKSFDDILLEFDGTLSTIKNDELKDLYIDFIEMREQIKSPMTDRALKILIKRVKELEPESIEQQKKLLENAILNKWKSVYPLKDNQGANGITLNKDRKTDLDDLF